MNYSYYVTAPWFIKVLFLFVLFTFSTKDYEIASLSLYGTCPECHEILPLPLRYIQSQGQNDKKRRV